MKLYTCTVNRVFPIGLLLIHSTVNTLGFISEISTYEVSIYLVVRNA